MTKLTIDHAFITRFNVPTPGREGLIRAQEGWLKDRVELFERFCAPSVAAQTCQDFQWLVYFDPDSPAWFMDWLDKGAATRRFTPVFRTSVSREDLRHDLRQATGGRGDVLLTTNLDNDDGLAVDFVRRVQDAVTSTNRTAMYLTRGLIVKGSYTYLRKDPHNAFCSVAESWHQPVTAWADWHNRLGLSMAVVEVPGAPAWLQSIHDRNVSNTVHGKLCNPAGFAHLFPYALTEVSNPGSQSMLIENGLLRPVRHVKASLRSGLKHIVLGALGKNRFDSLRSHAATANNLARTMVSRTKNLRWSLAARESGK